MALSASSLLGHRVELRTIALEDCTEAYVAWLRDPEVSQYLETRWTEQTLETVKAFVQQCRESLDTYLFAICERQAGKHIGNIKLGPINRAHSFADVSYFVGDKSAWGKGFATEAIALVTDFGFRELGLHRLQAGTYASNVGSARALQKVGYRKEGTLRGKLRNDGGWEDHVWYGLLAEDWKPRDQK